MTPTHAWSRRRCLQALGVGTLASLGTRAWALPAGATDARFLMVFLRGGCDGLNVLVPTRSDFYQEARPTIAIARPQAGGNADAAALALDADWGLHPALKDSLWPLWQARQLAFTPFAGTPDLSRSHFETQDTIEAGFAVGGRREPGSGLLNRLATELSGRAAAVSFTDGLPLIMQGEASVPNLSLKGRAAGRLDERQMALLSQLYDGHRLAPAVQEGLSLKKDVAAERDAEQMAANRQALSAKGFELEAQRMARMMQERFQIGFIDVGGWDTHVNQGGAQGTQANNLANLGQGLATFAREMGPQWSRTTVWVVTEFGRTFRENGSRGTDHGHGTVAWWLGGSVRGGRVLGRQQALTAATLNQGRDVPVLQDNRDLLAPVLARSFGLSGAAVQRVLPQSTPLDLGLL